MNLWSGQSIVLEYDGEVWVYDGSVPIEQIKEAPLDLKLEDGSFFRYASGLANQADLTAVEQIEMKHVIDLE